MFTLNCKGKLVTVDKPIVMGILNVTPDSFYEGSRLDNVDAVLSRAEQMLAEGADILDIGGQSTRPGSDKITPEAELQRVLPAIEAIHQRFPDAILSIDTYYSVVAKKAVVAGASIVNDISAGSMDEEMIPVVASLGVPYILMHMKGTPQTMQQFASYDNVTKDVLDFLVAKIATLRQAGIHDVIIDPGFGFGKTIAHNFELLNHLSSFKIPGCPLLLGISRKSTIYKTLGVKPEESLNGTTVLQTIGLLKGADIIRAHDVKEAKEAIRLIDALK